DRRTAAACTPTSSTPASGRPIRNSAAAPTGSATSSTAIPRAATRTIAIRRQDTAPWSPACWADGRSASPLARGCTPCASCRAAQAGYGSTLTLFAPGIDIRGAGRAGDSADVTWEGDSFAAPLAAGVVARYLQRHPRATPADAMRALTGSATRDVVGNAGQAPNLLLHVVE